MTGKTLPAKFELILFSIQGGRFVHKCTYFQENVALWNIVSSDKIVAQLNDVLYAPLLLVFHGCWSDWLHWNEWSYCAASRQHKCIGQQNRSRVRNCDNPKPSNGGRYCLHSNVENGTKYCPLEDAAGNYIFFLCKINIATTFWT